MTDGDALDKLVARDTLEADWRVSMSGYSIKTAWGDDKKVIAQIPANTPKEMVQAWINAAGDIVDAHNTALAERDRRIAELEADAERYRLLRKYWWNFGTSNYVHEGQIGGKKFWAGLDATHDAETPAQLDAAIDAARAKGST